MLLGDIDKLKVNREGANQADGFIKLKTGEQLFQPSFCFRRMRCAKLFAQGAHALFGLKEFFSAEPPQRFAEQIAEPVNVFAQRQIFR